MKVLKEKFSKNSKQYVQIKRTELVVLYGLTGDYTNEYTSFEVLKIYIHKPFTFNGKEYDSYERIAGNEEFGCDGSLTFPTLPQAEKYFEILQKKLISQQTDNQ